MVIAKNAHLHATGRSSLNPEPPACSARDIFMVRTSRIQFRLVMDRRGHMPDREPEISKAAKARLFEYRCSDPDR